MNFIKTALVWFYVSSKDPRKTSLTVKGLLLGIVPLIIQGISFACGFGLFCLGVTDTELNGVIEALEAITYSVLAFIASVITIWGFVRKVFRTATGTNNAIAP